MANKAQPARVRWWVHWTQGPDGKWIGHVFSLPINSAPVGQQGGRLDNSGPYATRAEAEQVAMSGAGPPQLGPGLNVSVPSVPNPFSWVGALSHWVGDLVLHVLDVHMWISVGWLLLGLILMVAGGYLFVRLSEPYQKANAAVTGAIAKVK